MNEARFQPSVDGTPARWPDRAVPDASLMRGHRPGLQRSSGHRRFVSRDQVVAGLGSLLFLAGAVATYRLPQLTAPLYIAGSGIMLTDTIVRAMAERRSTPIRPAAGTVATVRLVAVVAILVLGFWFGFRFP